MSIHRIGTAAGVSRTVVLEAVRASLRPSAIEAIAETVGLSVNTVRFHLDRLYREGLVARETTRPAGPGRPHLVFRAVAPEAVDGAAAYRLLAGLLAEGLVRTGDTRAVIEAGRSWADRLVAPHDPSVGGSVGGDENRATVARLVELFEDGGFAPQARPDAWTVALHRCPFRDLATVRADVVCALHLGFVRGVLQRLQDVAVSEGRVPHRIDADRVRLEPVLDDAGPCLVSLPAPLIEPRTE